MRVTEAKIVAREYLVQMFCGEPIGDVRVDEVVFAEERDMWQITISFSCPWGVPDVLASHTTKEHELRSYKCMHIGDRDGKVRYMLDRLLPPWADDGTVRGLPTDT